MAVFKKNGAVDLYYDNAQKLATTSTGIDVTGTVTADGLTVDGTATATSFNGFLESGVTATPTNSNAATIYTASGSHPDYASTDLIIQARSSAARSIYMLTGTTTPVNRFKVDATGDISFYDSAGTTAALFWDASAESLGIGTTSPSEPLTILSAQDYQITAAYNATNSTSYGYYGIKNNNTGNPFYFHVGGSERMRIDSSGNVGIGTDSPSQLLSINSTGSGERGISFDQSGAERVKLLYTNSTGGFVINNTTTGYTSFENNGSESVRIDLSGNLLVGKTDSTATDLGCQIENDGQIKTTTNGQSSITLNRKTSDGSIAIFQKDGLTVGSIGVINTNNLTIGGSVSNHSGLQFGTAVITPMKAGAESDAAIDIGFSNSRFKDIYATNGTIQTSDRNEKQDIEALTDAETRVAVAAKGLLRKFRWQSAVASKGDDARIHFGIIAQDLQDAFTAEGLDAGDYAMFISSTWTDDDGVEQTRLGVRYSELLAFIIAAI
jgi:hypothetical protein